MKKFLALLLAVLMIASMSVTAFASELEDSKVENGKTGDVKVQVTAKDGTPITTTGTYKVTVNWGNLLFKIEVADADTDVVWSSGKYTITNGTWDHTSTDVTVTNESDMPIKVDGKFDNNSTSSETVDSVNATIDGGLQNLDSAAGATAASDLVAEYVVAITQTVPSTVSVLEFTVDTIKLTIQTA